MEKHPPQCPLCLESVNADDAAFAFHVNRCLDRSASSGDTVASTSAHPGSFAKQSDCCPACKVSLDGMQVNDRTLHVQTCLAIQTERQRPKLHRSRVQNQIPALRLDTRSTSCSTCQIECGSLPQLERHSQICRRSQELTHSDSHLPEDAAADVNQARQIPPMADVPAPPPGTGSESIAAVYGLIPILQALLERSHASGHSVSSRLCSSFTPHITVGLSDALYGCGYRCCQMLYASMLHLPMYASHFASQPHSTGSHGLPSTKELQQYIESAWQQGYDPAGREHFEGRLVHRQKWIGTTELYVVFTYLGVKVRIIDFPKNSADGAHINLIRWVTRYFDQDPSDLQEKSPETPRKRMATFDMLMDSKGEACKQSQRQPLFLQHQGHSRVVIGVEKGMTEADTTLLLFDPAVKSKPRLRRAAASYAKESVQDSQKRARRGHPLSGKKDSDEATEDSSVDDASSEEAAAGRTRKSAASVGRWLKNLKPDSRLDLDKHAHLLSMYRVSAKELSKKSQYQILFVQDDGLPLDREERRHRRIPTSTAIH